MAAVQKQTLPSFSSIISVLSIVFYCVGFIRVELEMNEQKNRINVLENVAAVRLLRSLTATGILQYKD